MEKKYEDILYLPRPVSTRYAPLDVADRAAQFASFAAVTGFDGAIRETARLTQGALELDEDSKIVLDRKIQWLQQNIHRQPQAIFLCFVPDERKQGGAYIHAQGCVKKLDVLNRRLEFTDGRVIDLSGVIDLDCPDFENIDF